MQPEIGFEPTAKELLSAIGAFFICLSETMPSELASRVAQNALDLASDLKRTGEPNVSKICITFAESFAIPHRCK